MKNAWRTPLVITSPAPLIVFFSLRKLNCLKTTANLLGSAQRSVRSSAISCRSILGSLSSQSLGFPYISPSVSWTRIGVYSIHLNHLHRALPLHRTHSEGNSWRVPLVKAFYYSLWPFEELLAKNWLQELTEGSDDLRNNVEPKDDHVKRCFFVSARNNEPVAISRLLHSPNEVYSHGAAPVYVASKNSQSAPSTGEGSTLRAASQDGHQTAHHGSYSNSFRKTN